MGDGLTQGINDTTIYAEKKHWRNFRDPGKKFVLSLHYNDNDSYLFVNGRQELKFKCKKDQFHMSRKFKRSMDNKRIRKNRIIWKYL